MYYWAAIIKKRKKENLNPQIDADPKQ